MDTSIVLAQVFGIVFIILGLSMLFQKKYTLLIVEELVQNKSFIWIGGFMALLIGAVMITLNNVWTSGLPLIVTVLGWLSLIKGAFLLLFPNTAVSYYKKVNKEWKFVLAGIVVLIIGLVLVFY